jgi:hypothetical protein
MRTGWQQISPSCPYDDSYIVASRRRSASIGTVMHSLTLLVLLFELPLHLKVCLPFSFDALLLHVSHDTSMHSL